MLGVAPSATAAEIRAAHRARSRAYHPDRNRHDAAHQVSQALNNAIAILGDSEKKQAYDASSYGDTSGIDLMGGLVVTRDGAAASVAGSVVGGVVGAPLGAAAGVFLGLASAASDTIKATHSMATYRIPALQAWREAVSERARTFQRAAQQQLELLMDDAQLTVAPASMPAASSAPAPEMAVSLLLRGAHVAPRLTALGWWNRLARCWSEGSGSAAPFDVAAMALRVHVSTLLSRCSGWQGEAPATDVDIPSSDAVVLALRDLAETLHVQSRPELRLQRDKAEAAITTVLQALTASRRPGDAAGRDAEASSALGAAAAQASGWLHLAVAAAEKASAALRRQAGIVDTEGAGYDDPTVAAARLGLTPEVAAGAGLRAGADGALRGPSSAMGLVRMATSLAMAAGQDSEAVLELDAWLDIVRTWAQLEAGRGTAHAAAAPPSQPLTVCFAIMNADAAALGRGAGRPASGVASAASSSMRLPWAVPERGDAGSSRGTSIAAARPLWSACAGEPSLSLLVSRPVTVRDGAPSTSSTAVPSCLLDHAVTPSELAPGGAAGGVVVAALTGGPIAAKSATAASAPAAAWPDELARVAAAS